MCNVCIHCMCEHASKDIFIIYSFASICVVLFGAISQQMKYVPKMMKRIPFFLLTKRLKPSTFRHFSTGSVYRHTSLYFLKWLRNVVLPAPMLPSINTVNGALRVGEANFGMAVFNTFDMIFFGKFSGFSFLNTNLNWIFFNLLHEKKKK